MPHPRIRNLLVALTIAGLSVCALAEQTEPAATVTPLPIRYVAPSGWRQVDAPESPAQQAVFPGQVRLSSTPDKPDGPAILISAAVCSAPTPPGPTLHAMEECMKTLVTPDLFVKPQIAKRQETTLFGMPAVKLALRYPPDDGRPESRVVLWLATDGRRRITFAATAKQDDWTETWKAFATLMNSVQLP